MPMFGQTSLARNVSGIAIGTVVVLGIGYGIKFSGVSPAGPKADRGGSGAIVQQWGGTGSSLTGKIHSSGSLVLSGILVVGHRNSGSGRFLIQGADGGKRCSSDSDGTGCTCETCNNGTCGTYVGTTAECSPPDSI